MQYKKELLVNQKTLQYSHNMLLILHLGQNPIILQLNLLSHKNVFCTYRGHSRYLVMMYFTVGKTKVWRSFKTLWEEIGSETIKEII